ncbi:MAG: hypothetical protein RR817_09385 [Niameybacter sp.]
MGYNKSKNEYPVTTWIWRGRMNLRQEIEEAIVALARQYIEICSIWI